jgi:hypothetical protein
MQIFRPLVNFCSDKNIQTIFGTKLEDLNYRIDYNLISISNCRKSCEKNIFFFKRPEIMTLSCCIDNAKVSLHCHGI